MENLNIVQVYTDEEELKDIFNYLNTLMIHLILIIILF